VFDSRRIDAADREVEIDPAEYLDAGNDEPDQVGEPCRRFVMILQHDAAHPAGLRKPRRLDRVERSRPVVG
jgi:hypothetical protein